MDCVTVCLFACLSVWLCVEHTREMCKNGWTDRDAVLGADTREPKNHVLDGPRPPLEGAILGVVRPSVKHWESAAVYAAKWIIQPWTTARHVMRPSSKFCNHFYLEVLCKVFNIPFFRLPVYLPWRAWRRHFSLSHYRFPFFAGTYRVIKLLHSVTPFGDWVVWNTAMPVDRRIFSPLLLLRNPV